MTEFEIVGEPVVMDDGTEYRAIIQRQSHPTPPESDGDWPILKFELRSHRVTTDAEAYNAAAGPFLDKFTELADRNYGRGVREIFERYLKIFHGTTAVRTYGPNPHTDYTYIAFDTKEWRESMGIVGNRVEDLAKEDPLEEVRAWLEGDVWGKSIQHRWNPDNKLDDPDLGWHSHGDGWVWGFYGEKWAKQAVTEDLENEVAAHKQVPRYTEHEKIEPHAKAIDAITEFLEGLDTLKTLCAWNHKQGMYLPVPGADYQRVIFEHFGIDYDKIKEEREAMFKALSILNQPEGDSTSAT